MHEEQQSFILRAPKLSLKKVNCVSLFADSALERQLNKILMLLFVHLLPMNKKLNVQFNLNLVALINMCVFKIFKNYLNRLLVSITIYFI